MANSIPTTTAAMRRKPKRMWLTNVDTLEEMIAHYNPSEMEEIISVNYNRLKVLGLSHEILQYQNTGNLRLNMVLQFHAFDGTNEGQRNRVLDMKDAKRFIQSLCYSKRGAGDIAGGAPPRVLFIWPNYAALTCKITGDMTWKTTQQALDGSPMVSECKITLEEVRDFRLYSEDVRIYGIERG